MIPTGTTARAMVLGILAAGLLAATVPAPSNAAEGRFVNSLGMEFVRIPPGTFEMGSPPGEAGRKDDEPTHTVTLTRPLYMQTTEVTQGQWWAVMGKSFFSRRKGPPNLPVTKVSWHDARRFVARLNLPSSWAYRLPTEAEWEYAARAGGASPFPWGDHATCSEALFGNSRRGDGACLDALRSTGFEPERPAPVKTFAPNPWGLFDMHGNVSEWCLDWYGPYPSGPVSDPRGPGSGHERVRRGGSWFTGSSGIRSAARDSSHPAVRPPMTGFRLVWTSSAPDTHRILLWGEEPEGGP